MLNKHTYRHLLLLGTRNRLPITCLMIFIATGGIVLVENRRDVFLCTEKPGVESGTAGERLKHYWVLLLHYTIAFTFQLDTWDGLLPSAAFRTKPKLDQPQVRSALKTFCTECTRIRNKSRRVWAKNSAQTISGKLLRFPAPYIN